MGAVPFNFTVPVEFKPPRTAEGEKLRLTWVAGITVRVACNRTPDELAEIETWKFAELDPEGTVILEGTEAIERLELKLIDSPPFGANPVRATVPVD